MTRHCVKTDRKVQHRKIRSLFCLLHTEEQRHKAWCLGAGSVLQLAGAVKICAVPMAADKLENVGGAFEEEG